MRILRWEWISLKAETEVFEKWLVIWEKKVCQTNRNRKSLFGLWRIVNTKWNAIPVRPLQTSTDLSHAATSAQGAADLAKVVIIIPARQRQPCTLDAVEVVKAAVIGELSERWKTAGKGLRWEEKQDKGDVLRTKNTRREIKKQCQKCTRTQGNS